MRKMTLQRLAEELRAISKMYNPYEYNDVFNSQEEAFEYFEELLICGDIKEPLEMLENILSTDSQAYTEEHRLWAERLLWQLQEYKTYTKKDDKYAVLPMKNCKTYSISGDTDGNINEITGDFINKLHAYETTGLSPAGVRYLTEERDELFVQVEKQNEFILRLTALINDHEDLFKKEG